MEAEEKKDGVFRQESMEQWRPSKSCDIYSSAAETPWMLMVGEWRS